MTDGEREYVAESLLALIFSLRGNDEASGQAWTLAIATTVMARAVLASTGPAGDPTGLLDIAHQAVRDKVQAIQEQFWAKRLKV